MPPKKKGQKMALGDFFAETTGGSWADEMETLPTAPARREDSGPRRGEPGYLDSMPDRADRQQRTFSGAPSMREELPLPDAPPFTAFVGNLTFETEEGELREFFADLEPVSVRLVKDPQTSRPKGFGYVEFPSKDSLKAGLDRTGANLGGRSIRINVAEAPGSRFSSAADEASQWRRATPVAPRDAPTPRRNFSGASDGADRDWGAARGAKFTPSRETSGYGRPREEREREPRQHEPTAADNVDQWRSNKPLAAAVPAAGRPARGEREAPPHRPTGPADTESTWSRGTKASAPAAAPEPASRQRLNLLPRTASGTSGASSPDTAGSKASPFGAARPIDTAAREAEAEKHLEERRKAAEEKAAKAKEAKDAAEAAKKEKDAAKAKEARPVRVHPSRLPPKETKETKEPKEVKETKEVKEAPKEAEADGFETVSSGRRGKQQQEDKPAAAPRPANTKQGFSFAAAAGALGEEVDEVADKLAKADV